MNHLPIRLAVSCAVVAAMGSAHAQTPSAIASAPNTVGVTQSTAAEAARKAVPRNDTGTLVRTGPDAADRAGRAAAAVTPGRAASAVMRDTPAMQAGSSSDTTPVRTRRARSDRN